MAETQSKKSVKTDVSEAGAYAREAAASLNKAAQTAADRIVESGTQVREKMAADAEQAVKSLDGLAEDGRRFVRQNPGLSMAAAVGVGMLIGLAVKSHR